MDKIKGFTLRCLECNTSVRLNLPDSKYANETERFFDAIGKLQCPVCGESLSSAASKTLDAIKRYNAAVNELNLWENITLHQSLSMCP